MRVFVAINAMLLTFVLCWKSVSESVNWLPGKASKISVLSFNVMNLFDTQNDPLKMDDTFLPISKKQNPVHRKLCYKIGVRKWRQECLFLDWSEKALNEKLESLSKTIKKSNFGKGSDLVFLQEIENMEILNRLNQQYLPKMGYQAYLLEGADERGIDVALLSRLPLHSPPRLVKIPYSSHFRRMRSRPILHAEFDLPDGGVLEAYALHLPSAQAPASVREEALVFVKNRAEEAPSDRVILVAGDLNINSRESAQHKALERLFTKNWAVSHWVGCRTCRGTAFHGGTASFLDVILLRNSIGAWRMSGNGVRTFESAFSDHLAIEAQIVKVP